jgi:serine/threonine protein kinase/tetratricopeptide (TPR) repeat protein
MSLDASLSNESGDPRRQPSFAETRTVKREILAELHESWLQAQPIKPEQLLSRWPVNPGTDPDVAALLFQDFAQRQSSGESPSIEAYERRFPEHRDSLASLVRRQAFCRSISDDSDSSVPLALPSVNDEVFGFRLHRELGQGAFARVFLAKQAGLADRPVVLKVSAIVGSEPQTLARLQHTHIVPIYSLHDDPRAGLRAVCMPYFGGSTLGQVLHSTWSGSAPPSQGKQLTDILERLSAPRESDTPNEPDRDTPLALLGKLSYLEATVWIVARLAEALQHAHQRGVLHRDIKPSNILLSDDGQPMLLDFNLARNVADSQTHATLGGTVAYMAPEHLRALIDRDLTRASKVDQRSDLYSLGMVLFEMLAGRSPFKQTASYSPLRELVEVLATERSNVTPSLRKAGVVVPWSLESIVRKALAPNPTQRYQSAEDFAEDLRRYLVDQPLRTAPELSRTERIRKWMRRHPRLTSSGSAGSIAAVLLLVVLGILFGIRERLSAAQSRERRQSFEAGTTRALCLVNTTTDVLGSHLPDGLSECKAALDLYGVLRQDDWQQQNAWQRLELSERLRLAEDVRELLLLLAWGQVHADPTNPNVVGDALTLLKRAESIEGLPPSQALWRDRVEYLKLLGDSDALQKATVTAATIEPVSARDHYLLATVHARRGTPEGNARAVAELDRAIQINPRHYWSLVQRGICHRELGEHVLAAADFSNCIGLWPEFAWGYFNRGCALDQAGNRTQAILDYSAAIDRDPRFVLAFLNRGLARLELKQYQPALDDFDSAANLGRDDAFLHLGRGAALEGLARHQEADLVFDLAFARAGSIPEPQQLRLRWVYGFAVSARLPKKARQAFDEVLSRIPNHPQALYGRAMLLVEERKPEQALTDFDRALEANPNFVDARRFRAVLLARAGKIDQACQDIDWCLVKEPEAGVTLYAAACVAGLAAENSPDSAVVERASERALGFLAQALSRGYGQDRASADPDLAGIRRDPAFKRLLAKAAH